MTGRQALSKLKHDKKYSDEVINAIEKSLNEYQELKKQYDKIVRANLEIGQENHILHEINFKLLNDLNKLETVIKIIINKRVNVEWLLDTESVEEYNDNIFDTYASLSQEEYDLLKEEILWQTEKQLKRKD